MVLIKEYTYVCPVSSSVVESCPTIVPCTASSATILEDSVTSVGRSFTSVTYAKKNRNQLDSKLSIVRRNYLATKKSNHIKLHRIVNKGAFVRGVSGAFDSCKGITSQLR